MKIPMLPYKEYKIKDSSNTLINHNFGKKAKLIDHSWDLIDRYHFQTGSSLDAINLESITNKYITFTGWIGDNEFTIRFKPENLIPILEKEKPVTCNPKQS